MGKKGKGKEKKGKGAEKTAMKTERKIQNKLKKDLEVAGEDDIETILSNIEKEERKRLQVQESVIEKPTRRINFTFVPHPDKDELILFGGEFFNGQRTEVFNDLLFYNIPNNRWTNVKAPAGPPPRCGHQMVVTSANGGQLWVFGGEFASSSELQFHHYRDLWVYHLKHKKWEKVQAPNGPSSRSGHRMVIIKSKIFLFGGFHDNTRDYKYFSDVYMFDISSYQWSKLEPSGKAPLARSGCCMVPVADDKILIYGGYCKVKVKKDVDKGQVFTDSFLLTHDKNDTTGLKWKWVQTKIGGIYMSPRCSMPMTSGLNMKSFCFGGVFDVEDDDEQLQGKFYNDLLMLDIERLMWHNVTVAGKKKDNKTRRRKLKEDGDSNEDESSSEEIESISEAVESTTVADDGIFKVTVGPAPTSAKCLAVETSDFKVFCPSSRINCGLAIKKGILYLYGGMFEDENKEITYSDFYSLDLHKLDEWKTILTDETPQAEWIESDSESEGSCDSMEDEEESDSEDSESQMECQ